MHIPRRLTLLGACATLGLASCNTPTSQVQTIADLITAGVTTFAPIARRKASPDQQVTLDAAVKAIQAADAEIDASKGDTVVNVQIIVDWVRKATPIAIDVLPDGTAKDLASAAVSLLPAILRAAGVTPGPTLAAPAMDEGRATAVLKAVR